MDKIKPLEDQAAEAKGKIEGNDKAKAAQRETIDNKLNAATRPFRTECEKQREKMKGLVDDLKSLKATCDQLPEIIVMDCWGVPLVMFKVKFFVPGNEVNIGFVRRLGTLKTKKK